MLSVAQASQTGMAILGAINVVYLQEPNMLFQLASENLHWVCTICWAAAAAAKSLQSCPTLCDPIDCSPPDPPIPGILQARTLEWVAISFSNAWSEKWKWSRSVVSNSLRPHGLQPTRLLRPWDFPGKSTVVGCHCLLRYAEHKPVNTKDQSWSWGAQKSGNEHVTL